MDSAQAIAAAESVPQNDADFPTEDNVPSVSYSYSSGFMERLAQLNVSLAFSSYQSGFLYMLGSTPAQGAQLHQSVLAKPMGLARDPAGGLVVATEGSIIRYRNILSPHEQANHVFDACFMPRTIHVTGQLDAHDIGVDGDGRLIFVNTRFNCLATTSDIHSFAPVWLPPFISALVDEDRCHLNGLAMEEGRPAFVTAVSRSDVIDGWRDRRRDGGVVIDVRTGEIVCEGLSMPHSPRVHNGELWLLNAGTGELGMVSHGKFHPRMFCPGFGRGLAFHGNLAFVGLSKPRYQRFEGLALDQRLKDADADPWCGIQIIDVTSNTCVDWFRIDGDVTELYDLVLIEGHRCPMATSPSSGDAVSLITFDKIQPRPLQLPGLDQTTRQGIFL